MKTYADEVRGARRYAEKHAPPRLTEGQLAVWRQEARSRLEWTTAHARLHDALNATLFTVFIAADLGGLALISRLAGFWTSALVASVLHGWLLYGITSVSLHEGAGHGRLVLGRSPTARLLRVLLDNVCRLGFADPRYYRSRHPSHHVHLGTERDGAFTHLVRPGRVLRSLLPLAGLLPFNDYRIHAGGPYSRSRALSDLIGAAWMALGIAVATRAASLPWALLVVGVLGPWFAFVFDRLRETVDHALLLTDSPHAARSLGLGFWGWALAPGPWGQCAHLVHHLFPALPWYQQALMHRSVARGLSVEQRRHHVLAPGLGLLALLLRMLREGRRYTGEARHA